MSTVMKYVSQYTQATRQPPGAPASSYRDRGWSPYRPQGIDNQPLRTTAFLFRPACGIFCRYFRCRPRSRQPTLSKVRTPPAPYLRSVLCFSQAEKRLQCRAQGGPVVLRPSAHRAPFRPRRHHLQKALLLPHMHSRERQAPYGPHRMSALSHAARSSPVFLHLSTKDRDLMLCCGLKDQNRCDTPIRTAPRVRMENQNQYLSSALNNAPDPPPAPREANTSRQVRRTRATLPWRSAMSRSAFPTLPPLQNTLSPSAQIPGNGK